MIIGAEKTKSNTSALDFSIKERYLLLTYPTDESGLFTFTIVHFMNKNVLDADVTFADIGEYTGNIALYNFKGIDNTSVWYIGGEQFFQKKPICHTCRDVKEEKKDKNIVVVVYTDHYKEWHKRSNNGSWQYTHTTYHGRTQSTLSNRNRSFSYYRSHPKYSSGGGNFGSAVSGIVDAESETIEKIASRNNREKTITTDPEINECVEKIISKLMQKNERFDAKPYLQRTEMNHLSSYVLNLFTDSAGYNLRFTQRDLGTDDNGGVRTGTTIKDPKDNNTYLITLDKNLVRRGSRLIIAQTIIHESMHAFLQRSVANLRSDRNHIAGYLLAIYNDLELKENGFGLSHHEFISQYVEAMAYSLRFYDNKRKSLQYYIDLGWAGLHETGAYKALSERAKRRSNTVILNELSNKNGSDGGC